MDLFVYGTLTRSGSNHALLGASPERGTATTEAGYGLVDLGGYPGLVRSVGLRVAGELYAVGPAVLERLDLFELHPHVFRRSRIALSSGDPAWAYLLEPHLAREAPVLAPSDGQVVRWG